MKIPHYLLRLDFHLHPHQLHLFQFTNFVSFMDKSHHTKHINDSSIGNHLTAQIFGYGLRIEMIRLCYAVSFIFQMYAPVKKLLLY